MHPHDMFYNMFTIFSSQYVGYAVVHSWNGYGFLWKNIHKQRVFIQILRDAELFG